MASKSDFPHSNQTLLHRFRRYAVPCTPNTKTSESNLFIFPNYFSGRLSIYNIGLLFALHQQESVSSTQVLPHPEPSSHFTPQTIVLCCPRAQALGALHHALNLHQLSVYVRSCTCFKAILSSHPTVALSTESKSLFFPSLSLLLPCM